MEFNGQCYKKKIRLINLDEAHLQTISLMQNESFDWNCMLWYSITSSLAVTMEVQAINYGNAFSLHNIGNIMVRVSVKVLKKRNKMKLKHHLQN